MTGKGALERAIIDVLRAEQGPLLVLDRVNEQTERPLAYPTVADRLVAKGPAGPHP